MPASFKVFVAPFTQPLTPAQLIAGQIPEDQGRIPPDDLIVLDQDLRAALGRDAKRSYTFIPAGKLPANWGDGRSSGQPTGLARWLAYAREQGAQYLLVPQILDWHEREGSEAGVTSSAHVRAEFFLLNVPRDMVASRSVFEEKQLGLAENLLSMGDFIKRRGKWLSARELADEAMLRAVKELGL